MHASPAMNTAATALKRSQKAKLLEIESLESQL